LDTPLVEDIISRKVSVQMVNSLEGKELYKNIGKDIETVVQGNLDLLNALMEEYSQVVCESNKFKIQDRSSIMALEEIY